MKKTNKVLIINYEYPPFGGGGGVAAKKLAEALVKIGYEVDYLTSGYNGLADTEVINGVNIFRVNVLGRKEKSNASMVSLITFPLCAYKKAFMLCKSNNYYFINTHFAVPSGPLGVWLSKRFKIPNILSLHGGDIYDPTKKFSPHRWWVFRQCVKWVINNSYKVVAQSSNTQKNANDFYGISRKIEIIPLPYDYFDFKVVPREMNNLDSNSKYVISVGRLVKRKGYEFLINSISRLNSVKLIIVGEGPERINLEKQIENLRLQDRVILTGNVDEEQKYQYLNNSDLYVLSSVHEGFGIVLQEAMQVGLPIIATNYGGQVDLIIEGVNGFLVDYGDEESLAKRINDVLTNLEASEKMRAKNLKLIKEYESINIAKAYLNTISN